MFRWRGLLHRIIDKNDTSDGREISNFSFGFEGLDGDQIAFSVRLADDRTYPLYVATVQELSAIVLAAITAIFIARMGRPSARGAGSRCSEPSPACRHARHPAPPRPDSEIRSSTSLAALKSEFHRQLGDLCQERGP